jgi:hypothetical protein
MAASTGGLVGNSRGTDQEMSARFNIVGCIHAAGAAPELLDGLLGRARKLGVEVLSRSDKETVLIQYDAEDAALITLAMRAVVTQRPSVLHVGFASGVKEMDKVGAHRLGERGIVQATDLAAAAKAGEVLISSQLGSLLQIAQEGFASRLRPTYVRFVDGRRAAAYRIAFHEADPLRGPITS